MADAPPPPDGAADPPRGAAPASRLVLHWRRPVRKPSGKAALEAPAPRLILRWRRAGEADPAPPLRMAAALRRGRVVAPSKARPAAPAPANPAPARQGRVVLRWQKVTPRPPQPATPVVPARPGRVVLRWQKVASRPATPAPLPGLRLRYRLPPPPARPRWRGVAQQAVALARPAVLRRAGPAMAARLRAGAQPAALRQQLHRWRRPAVIAALLAWPAAAQFQPPSLPDAGTALRRGPSVDPGGASLQGGLDRPGSALTGGPGRGPDTVLNPFGEENPEGAPSRGWTFTPSLALDLQGTDNVRLTQTNRQADFITTITPSILLSGESARLRGSLNYSPYAQFYANTPAQNRFDQRFNGNLLATVVEDVFFVDVRGSSAVSSLTGGFATPLSTTAGQPSIAPVIGRQDQLQTTSIQVSPFLLQRFGGTATVRAGYNFQYVNQSSGNTGLGGIPSQETLVHTAYAVTRTGENFGRLALQNTLSHTTYSGGSAVLRGAYRDTFLMEGRYALDRTFAVLAEAGYEDQRYGGPVPYQVRGGIWAVGGRITGNESQVTAKYGYRDGFYSFFLDGAVSLGGRTRIFANYSERLTTSALRAADLLSTTEIDAYGNPVDAASGAPVYQGFASSVLPTQVGLQRIKLATASISQGWERDNFTLSFFHEDRTPVGGTAGVGTVASVFAGPQRGVFGSFTWGREWPREVASSLTLQYGQTNGTSLSRNAAGALIATPNTTSDVVSLVASGVYRINPSLSAILQYRLTQRWVSGPANDVVQNVVLLGLRQTF